MTDKKTTYGPETAKAIQVFTAQAVVVSEALDVPLAHVAHFLMYWAQRQDAIEQCLETIRARDVPTATRFRAQRLTPEDTMEEWRAEVVAEQSAALAIIDDMMITAEQFDPAYRKPYLSGV